MAAKQKKSAERSTKIRRLASSLAKPGKPNLYTLEVVLAQGPVTEEFIEKNPVISRTIQIRGDQTLEILHEAIFGAYDRDDEHMYEFQFGKRPMDRKAPRYVLPMALDGYELESEAPIGLVGETTIGSLNLKVRGKFLYWFDFGDDWWHQIKVQAIEPNAPKGKYPKITQRVGQSPPQYLGEDDY